MNPRTAAAIAALLLSGFAGRAAQVSTIRIASPDIPVRGKTIVVLPDSYQSSKSHYPVVYFLHGYNGSHRSWLRYNNFADRADRYQCIFVCPSAGPASWYLDSPIKNNSQAQTYIANTVTTWIDTHYRTLPRRSKRALVGSSMGGHGALTMVRDYPELFCAVVAISAPMELVSMPDLWDIKRVLGPFDRFAQRWQDASFLYTIDRLVPDSCAFIQMDCGKSDWALAGNREADAKLLAADIGHTYEEHDGSHTPEYVAAALDRQFEKLMARLGLPETNGQR